MRFVYFRRPKNSRQFAYFGRPRGKVPTEKYIKDMQEDAREWLYRSKLPLEDRVFSKVPSSHESMHSLIDPLRQPTQAEIRQHYTNDPNLSKMENRYNAYREAQGGAKNSSVNDRMENIVAGLEGYKAKPQIDSSSLAAQQEYWKGKRVRKKAFSRNHMKAANLVELHNYDVIARKPPAFSIFDDIIGPPRQLQTLDPKDSYLLERAVVHGQKLSPKTIHRLLSKYGKLISERLH